MEYPCAIQNEKELSHLLDLAMGTTDTTTYWLPETRTTSLCLPSQSSLACRTCLFVTAIPLPLQTGAEDSSGHRYVGTNGLRVFNHHILLSSTGWTEIKIPGLGHLVMFVHLCRERIFLIR